LTEGKANLNSTGKMSEIFGVGGSAKDETHVQTLLEVNLP